MKKSVHNDRVWDFETGGDVMSVHEVADRLGIGINQAYVACKKGQIPNIRVGKRFIVPRAAYLNWMATCGGQFT